MISVNKKTNLKAIQVLKFISDIHVLGFIKCSFCFPTLSKQDISPVAIKGFCLEYSKNAL